MFKSFISIILTLTTTAAFADLGSYKITVTNLTGGQPITPVLAVAHDPGFDLYQLGEKASEGLAYLAVDGGTDLLKNEASVKEGFISSSQAEGLTLPGESKSFVIQAKKGNKISLVAMLARTNDAFIGLKNIYVPTKKNYKIVYLADVYDAGAEVNTESCDHIPAPPCDSHKVGEKENSFVRPHAGIQNIGDLDALRDSFASKAAKVTIELMQ